MIGFAGQLKLDLRITVEEVTLPGDVFAVWSKGRLLIDSSCRREDGTTHRSRSRVRYWTTWPVFGFELEMDVVTVGDMSGVVWVWGDRGLGCPLWVEDVQTAAQLAS